METWDEPEVRSLLATLNRAAPRVYLVGGAVRDRFMGRDRGNEVDLLLDGDAVAVAERVAGPVGRGVAFVPLDPARGTARLVLGRGSRTVTIDVTTLRRPTLEADLAARDFTINALALALDDFLAGRSGPVLDPTGGLRDIEAGVVRVCSAESFVEDPLRILRAFRFKADLGFRISDETLELIPASLPALAGVAGERIRDEIIAMLAAERSTDSLREMDRCGLIDALFPDLAPMRGLDQNPYHHLDAWSHTLEAVRQLEILLTAADRFGDLAQIVRSYADEEPVAGRPKRALLKLALLFHDAGKPHTMSVDTAGKVRFFGHEKISLEIFQNAGSRLKLASRELRLVGDLVAGHMRPMIFTLDRPTPRAVFRLHRKFGSDITGLVLVFLADLTASRGPARPPETYDHAFRQALSALRVCFERERESVPPLLTGRDLMKLFDLKPGRFLGGILKRLAVLQGSGEITTREEAISAAEALLRKRRMERMEE
ncbi:MAG: HD domain-containing protein [Desulfomonile sp.]|nr:HD domain-containing protein [Desulfomonile sp.]